MRRIVLVGITALGVLGLVPFASAGGAEQCVKLREDVGTVVLTITGVGQVHVRAGTLGVTTGYKPSPSVSYGVLWENAVSTKTGDLVGPVLDPVRPYTHLGSSNGACPVFEY